MKPPLGESWSLGTGPRRARWYEVTLTKQASLPPSGVPAQTMSPQMFVRKSGFLYIWLHMLLLMIATCTSWRVLGDGRPVWGMEDRETDPWILFSWKEWHRVYRQGCLGAPTVRETSLLIALSCSPMLTSQAIDSITGLSGWRHCQYHSLRLCVECT